MGSSGQGAQAANQFSVPETSTTPLNPPNPAAHSPAVEEVPNANDAATGAARPQTATEKTGPIGLNLDLDADRPDSDLEGAIKLEDFIYWRN